MADINNAVRRITPDGTVTAIAGSNQADRKLIDASGAAASFSRTGPLTVGPDGSVYVVDTYNNANGALRTALRRIAPTGEVTTPVAEFWPHSGIGGLAFSPDGTLYLTDAVYNMVFKLKGSVLETVRLSTNDAFSPHGIAIDQDGNLFLTESTQVVSASRVAQMAADGTLRILGGVQSTPGWQDGVGTKSLFDGTAGIGVDSRGNLYVACSSNVIRKGMPVGAPVITTQPQGATVAAGGSVQLAVVASGVPAPTYQWFRNGTAIDGATAPNYTIANLSSTNTGSYSVTVSNVIGSVTSSTAVVALSTAPSGGSGNGGGSASGTTSSAGAGGGGGAPSVWFLGILSLLGVTRRFWRPARV